MRMTTHPYPKIRLYVEHPLNKGATIPLELHQLHYLGDVMRMKDGETLALFNGKDGEWSGVFQRSGKKSAHVMLETQTRPYRDAPDIWLAFSPVKGQATEYLVQKATELGASKLVPVLTDYGQIRKVNLERLRKNAIEAAEQTERVDVPEIAEPVELSTLLHTWPKERTLFYGDEQGSGISAAELRKDVLSPPLALLVGPEGGFSASEHYILGKTPFIRAISMGPRVLRADTACVVGLTLLMLLAGDWDHHPRFRAHS